MARTISQRINADRGRAGFFAFLASLPALAIVGGALWVFVLSLEHRENTEDLVFSGLALVFAGMFWLITGWSYSAARSAMTPQRIQAMWLRRFQAEKGDDFRPSRVIDKLSRYGVSAITLQDRDVKLSFEQRRNRLAPMFWFFFAPIALVLSYAGFTSFQQAQQDFANQAAPASANIAEALMQAFVQAIGQAIVLVLIIAVFALAVIASAVLFFLVAAIAGPLGAIFSGKRDDFRRLPRLLERMKRGKGRRGASIVRISDAHWRDAVTASLGAVDVAIIDLTDVSEHVAWEISEAVKARGVAGLVFICSNAKGGLSDTARNIVRGALGRDPGSVVHYPDRRGGDAKRFARELREHIYEAADHSGAKKG
jgi:hypothetical protein